MISLIISNSWKQPKYEGGNLTRSNVQSWEKYFPKLKETTPHRTTFTHNSRNWVDPAPTHRTDKELKRRLIRCCCVLTLLRSDRVQQHKSRSVLKHSHCWHCLSLTSRVKLPLYLTNRSPSFWRILYLQRKW